MWFIYVFGKNKHLEYLKQHLFFKYKQQWVEKKKIFVILQLDYENKWHLKVKLFNIMDGCN
jgi:hypothetical protein